MNQIFYIVALLGFVSGITGCSELDDVSTKDSTTVVATLDLSARNTLSLRYETAQPVESLSLQRVPDGQRETRWRFEDQDFILRHDGETKTDMIMRKDGAPFKTVTVMVPTTYTQFPKDYAPFMPYREAGLLIHSGRFQACPERCGDDARSFPMTLVAPKDEHILIFGEVLEESTVSWDDTNDGTMVYVGSAKPVETEHVISIVDPALPSAFRSSLDQFFPLLMRHHAERLGSLRAKPMLFAALDQNTKPDGDPKSSNFSSQGGTLPGQVFMHLAGDGWLEPSSGWSVKIKGSISWFFAHEAAHLYQQRELADPDIEHYWIHEGGANALAALSLMELKTDLSGYVQARLNDDAARCADGLKDGPLGSAGARGAFDLYYSCGMLIQLTADAEIRRYSNGKRSLYDAWVEFMDRVATGDPWDAATFLDVLTKEGAINATLLAEEMLSAGSQPEVAKILAGVAIE